jgi:hypothetical protein
MPSNGIDSSGFASNSFANGPGNRSAPSVGTPTFKPAPKHVRSVRRSRSKSKPQENGNRSRTRFADRSRRRGRILITFTVICAVELVLAVLTSPGLNVNHIVVHGITEASSLTKEEIDAAHHAVTLPPETNWLLAPVALIQSRLTALPWVRSATVSRRFPTDVAVVIEPRTPSYSLITPAGRYEVGEDNTPIRPLRRELENRLTPIVLNSSETPRPGTVIADVPVRTASLILRQTHSDSTPQIAKIEIDRSTNIWLNMSTGVRVKFGHCEDVDKKIAMMRRLLSHDPGARFAEINVTCPDWPAGTLRETMNQGSPAEVSAATSNDHTAANNLRSNVRAGATAIIPIQAGRTTAEHAQSGTR